MSSIGVVMGDCSWRSYAVVWNISRHDCWLGADRLRWSDLKETSPAGKDFQLLFI